MGVRQLQLTRQMLGVEVPVEHGVTKPLPKMNKIKLKNWPAYTISSECLHEYTCL